MQKGREQSLHSSAANNPWKDDTSKAIPQNSGSVTQKAPARNVKSFPLLGDPRHTFEGAKYSTYFLRLTRLGQWLPRGKTAMTWKGELAQHLRDVSNSENVYDMLNRA